MTELEEPKLKKVSLDSAVKLSIEPKTRLLLIRQGDNEVKLTRDAIIGMRKLHDGENSNEAYVSPLIPRSRFTVAQDGSVSIVCKDEWESNVILLKKHTKEKTILGKKVMLPIDDYQRVLDYVDSNKTRIAWAKEFKGMR